MNAPKGGQIRYPPEVYALLRACCAAVSAHTLILELLEMLATPHGIDQHVRYMLAAKNLAGALEWLKRAQRQGPGPPLNNRLKVHLRMLRKENASQRRIFRKLIDPSKN